MKFKIYTIGISGLVLGLSSLSGFASGETTTKLKIKGTLVPRPCTIKVIGQSVIDLGSRITLDRLSGSSGTVRVTLQCPEVKTVYFNLKDESTMNISACPQPSETHLSPKLFQLLFGEGASKQCIGTFSIKSSFVPGDGLVSKGKNYPILKNTNPNNMSTTVSLDLQAGHNETFVFKVETVNFNQSEGAFIGTALLTLGYD